MSHLSNPLVTAQQLRARASNGLPIEMQDCICYQTARLTQAAGLLLRLPQEVAAQAVVLLQRFWVDGDVMQYEFSDASASALFLASKISAWPRSLRSITNVYTYLLSTASHLFRPQPSNDPNPTAYYLSDSSYHAFRSRILLIEGQILNSISFNTHVALPHPLAITYSQTLDLFTAAYPHKTGQKISLQIIRHLNSALLSPQLLYLTHQPNALAIAAIYLAARDLDIKLPEVEWWEVFDVDREELGFLVVAFRSLEGWIREVGTSVGEAGRFIERRDIKTKLKNDGLMQGPVGDEEDEMMRLLDEKVGA